MKKVIKFFSLLLLINLFPFFVLAGWEETMERWEEMIRNIGIAAAVLMIVIGGFQWMVSGGDPGKIASAKDRIYSAIFGLLIIILASVILGILGINR